MSGYCPLTTSYQEETFLVAAAPAPSMMFAGTSEMAVDPSAVNMTPADQQPLSDGIFNVQPNQAIAMQGMMYPSTHLPMNVHHEGVNGPVEASWTIPSAAPALAYGFGAHSLPSNYHQLHYPGERGAQVHNFGVYDHRVGVKTFHSSHDAHPCSERSIAADRGSSKDNQTYWEQSKYAMQKQQLSRFQATLCSRTAMFYKDEVPTTFLNKGQTYMLKVVDTTPTASGSLPLKYVTSIRISFQDDDLRSKAADCWRLWKRTRGRNSDNDREERQKQWRAVDLVDGVASNQASPALGAQDGTTPDGVGRSSNQGAGPELVRTQFDGLTVTWSPNQLQSMDQPQECLIPLRFNFLSTDFMPSKGVKGAQMRLCVKTKVYRSGNWSSYDSPHGVASPHTSSPFASSATAENTVNPMDQVTNETWFCKLQTFRDHGAERKFQNHRPQIESAIANNSAKLANLLSGSKEGDSTGPRGATSTPSSDPGCGRASPGTSKVTRRRKGANSADLIARLQNKLDALRFALESAEDSIMLTMTSCHPDDDPEAPRPDVLENLQGEISEFGSCDGADESLESSFTSPSAAASVMATQSPMVFSNTSSPFLNLSTLEQRPNNNLSVFYGSPSLSAPAAIATSPYSNATEYDSPIHPTNSVQNTFPANNAYGLMETGGLPGAFPMQNTSDLLTPTEYTPELGAFHSHSQSMLSVPITQSELLPDLSHTEPMAREWDSLSDSVRV